MLLRKILVLGVILLMGIKADCQLLPTDSTLLRIFESDVLLPILIDSAIKNSPEVKSSINSIGISEENTRVNKRNIFSGVSFLSSYNYGTTGDLTIGKEGVVGGQFSNFSSTKSDRYNLGINLALPLTSVINRKSLLRSSKLQEEIAESSKEITVTNVKQEVIRMYQELKLAQKLLLFSGKNKQSAFVNFSLTEKEFLRGNGDYEQFSRMQEIYSKATVEYESSINRFQTIYLLLETYTRTRLSNLITKLK